MSSSPARSPSPPTTNLPFQPQISPYTQGSQSNPSNYPWPQPSTYNPSMPLPNGPYSIPPDESLLRPAAQQQPPPQSSSRPNANVDSPPMKPPTDDQLWKLVQYYLYSSNELRSPVVYTSSLVIIFGFDDKVTAESLARTIRSFSIRNHNTGEKEYPYEKTLIRTWLIRSRLLNAETYSDGTLKSTNIKHSGSTPSSPLGCSWRFAFASFDKPSSAYSFYKDFNSENGFGPKLPLNPSCKIKMANPLKAFVRLEPDDEEEFENMRYGWKGVGLKGWDGVRRDSGGNDLTFWSIEDDRVGSDMWIASEYNGERETSSKGKGKRPSQSVYDEERKVSRSRSRGWEVEDDDDDVVVTGSSKGIPQDRSNSDEGSRKKPRLDQDLGSDDIGSTNSNDRTEKSRKVPQLAGSKKVAKDISKWQTKQSELHQDPPSSSSDSQPQPSLSKSNSLPTQSSTATPVLKEVPMDYDFADLVKKACLLCVRQFKTIEMLRRHEADSALHKGNLLKDELRKAGYDRKTSALNKRAKTEGSEKKIPNGFAPINSNPIPTSSATKDDASSSFSIDTTSKYRDRASERRSVFGADKPSSSSNSSSHRKEDKRKVFEGPAPVLASEESEPSSNHNREEEIDESNSGFKMLAQMGWEKGKGLGTELQGRSSIVEAGHHRMGAGLGSGSSNGNGRDGSEEGRGYKGGYKGGKKTFDKGYLEAMRDSARERFEGK